MAEVNVNEVMTATAKTLEVLRFRIVAHSFVIPCERSKPHMKIIPCAIDAVEQLIHCPGVVLVPGIGVNKRNAAEQQRRLAVPWQHVDVGGVGRNLYGPAPSLRDLCTVAVVQVNSWYKRKH
jgi:hypothetical protein